ncbi:MAG: hypothetical protein IIA45_14230 [Bacteroidetes bacterium]|nr:hypothetical protein [Bacteroidota bacterium]
MKRAILSIFISLIIVFPFVVQGQQFYRVKADFSIKEKNADSTSALTMGTVYYDKNVKQIIYEITFPRKETWILSDTTIYRLVEGKLESKTFAPNMAEFTIFHLTLTGNLYNYGLEKSVYKIIKVEKEEDMVLSTWAPQGQLKEHFGNVIMSHKEKKLFGIVMLSKEEEKVLSRQFFRKYQNINGLEFPGEILQFTYKGDGENIKMTTFKNIIIDDVSENEIYNYSLSDLR